MTRKSKREIERQLEELASGQARGTGQPLTNEERTVLADADLDVEAWTATSARRRMLRALAVAAATEGSS